MHEDVMIVTDLGVPTHDFHSTEVILARINFSTATGRARVGLTKIDSCKPRLDGHAVMNAPRTGEGRATHNDRPRYHRQAGSS
jgi:hypothetical protein